MKYFAVILLSAFGLNCYAQSFLPTDFKATPVPKDGSAEWYRLNRSPGKSFSVAIVDGRLQISQYVYSAGSTAQLPTGTLVAVDLGEFGGGLLYKPSDTTQTNFYVNGKTVKTDQKYNALKFALSSNDRINPLLRGPKIVLQNGNIHNFFSYRDSLYFLDGLSHMGINKGAIYKLAMNKNTFTTTQQLGFDDAPHAVANYHDTLFVATFKRFYLINKWTKELVFDKLFWYGFNPNSVAVLDNRHIFVGLTGGYVKIDLLSREMAFYAPKSK